WLKGYYVFGDYGSGTLWRIPTGRPGLQTPVVLLRTELNPSSFGQDESGELFVLDLHGAVYKLVPAP
ncbi:MAG TPA: glucose dehydrogenase, partial [bacterium]|nr:glucose dehydrogenase [bacterium]